MSTTSEPTIPTGCIREITTQEVSDFQTNGWARLDRLVDAEAILALLTRLKAVMGTEAEREVSGGYGVKTSRPPESKALFTSYENPSNDDEEIHGFSFSIEMGRVLSRAAESPIRSWGDNCFVKMPVGKAGGKTPWHQDWPYYPFDRCGSLTLWIALVEVPPERGSMRFVNGSHRWGPLGRVIGRKDGLDTLDILPGALKGQVDLSPALHLMAGDATIHDDLTIHSAPANATHEPRWAFTMAGFPADTLYTGAPQRRTDDLGLELNRPLDHPNFPLLKTSPEVEAS
jgi:Phytanoyl-CoA dioxygenase (PhyH)